ncbi:hypothetical protein Nmel_012629, partial [Mimus melanotis]
MRTRPVGSPCRESGRAPTDRVGGYGYCGHWGCKTIVTGNRWKPQQPDKFLQIKYIPHGCLEPKFNMEGYILMPQGRKQHTCTGYIMTILQPTHDGWATGKTWTAFVHLSRRIWANIQIIRLTPPMSPSVEPNLIQAEVEGRGKCFGNATLAKQMGNVCRKFVKLKGGKFQWVIPATSGMWVCQQSGVSPCILLNKFNHSADFCVQVLIVPRVLYRQEEE